MLGFFDKYPYTDFHELNLDWLIKSIRDLAAEVHNWEVVNKISYGGDWDISKQYTPWTIVCVNGTEGYISVQPVPAGINYDNTDYWRLVSDFTVQLAGLGQRVSDLEAEDIVINGKINTINNNITSINNDLLHSKRWADRRVLWVGDSYGNGWDGSQSIADPYTIASGYLGCSFENISHGGCRFGINTTDPQYMYKTYIGNYVSSHSDMDTFTDVIIIGGANDIIFNPASDISSEMNLTINYVKQHFPNANIHIGMVARLANTGANNCTFGNFDRIMRKYREGARNNGVHYITNSEVINHDYTLLANDGIHLSDYTKMGRDLAELLLSGSFDEALNIPCNVTLPETDNDNIKPSTLSFLPTVRYGSTLLIAITELAFTFTGGKTLTWHKAYKFAKVSGDTSTRNGFSGASRSVNYNISCEVDYVENGVTKHETMPFTLYLWDNYLWLSWESLTSDGSTSINISNINCRGGLTMLVPQELC